MTIEPLDISDNTPHAGDLNADAITVSNGALRVSGTATIQYFLLVSDGGSVELSGGTVPLLLVETGGTMSGDIQAKLSIDVDDYEEEDFDRLVAALSAALAGASLDALWDELEEDYEEDVDHLREDGSVEDALNILFSSGIPSLLIDYACQHGDLNAMVAAL